MGFEEASEGENITWTITDSSGLACATRRLHTEQPKTLVIDIPSDVLTPPALQQFCQVVQKTFTGDLTLQLWRSNLEYDNCDESIAVLADFKLVHSEIIKNQFNSMHYIRFINCQRALFFPLSHFLSHGLIHILPLGIFNVSMTLIRMMF